MRFNVAPRFQYIKFQIENIKSRVKSRLDDAWRVWLEIRKAKLAPRSLNPANVNAVRKRGLLIPGSRNRPPFLALVVSHGRLVVLGERLGEGAIISPGPSTPSTLPSAPVSPVLSRILCSANNRANESQAVFTSIFPEV